MGTRIRPHALGECTLKNDPSMTWPHVGASRSYRWLIALLIVAVLGTMPAANAIDKDDINIKGFGGWAYGITDGNRYLIGDSDGLADNVQFALNLTITPSDRFTIVTQVEWEQGQDDIDTELEYAFVQIKLTQNLDLRLGRVKHPFGIYAEVFDVGTLRPFFLLPQSIYGPQGITAEHYDGIGLRGGKHGPSWGVDWDLYAGAFDGEIELPGPVTGDPNLVFTAAVESPFELEDVVGARLNIFPPVDGLSFGVSLLDGSQSLNDLGAGTQTQIDASYAVYGAHIEYLTDVWSIRAERARFEVADGDNFEGDGFYLELARRFGQRWQVAARYDDFDSQAGPGAPIADPTMLPPFASQFFESQDIGFGINYWFSPELVIRLNVHQVEGNRFAFPDNPADVQQSFATGQLEDETELVILGAQFSF